MKDIFFIIGTGRCGTQMLRKALNIWKDVVILPETHFIITLYDKFKLENVTTDQFLEVVDNTYSSSGEKWVKVILNTSKKRYETYKKEFTEYIKNKSVDGNIKIYTEQFFQYLYGENYTFGDKTPHYGANLDIILKIWPKAKIIYLQRDGVNTSLSMLRHSAFIKYINSNIAFKDIGRYKYHNKEKNFSNKKPNTKDAILFWKNATNQIDHSLNICPKNQLLYIKYEDFVYNNFETMTKLINFLNLKNSILYRLEASLVVKPFKCLQKPEKVSIKEYFFLYKLISTEMKKHNYPIVFKKKGNFFLEILRSVLYYFLLFFSNLKILIFKLRLK